MHTACSYYQCSGFVVRKTSQDFTLVSWFVIFCGWLYQFKGKVNLQKLNWKWWVVTAIILQEAAPAPTHTPSSNWYICHFECNSWNYIIKMHLLFHNNHRCLQINQDWNLLSGAISSCNTGVCALVSCVCACVCLVRCMPIFCQNNANPLIPTAFGILFLLVPTWHCSLISGAGCLRKPVCTLLHGTAPRRNGPHLWDPETMCVQKKKKKCAAGLPLIFYSVPL